MTLLINTLAQFVVQWCRDYYVLIDMEGSTHNDCGLLRLIDRCVIGYLLLGV